MPDDIIFEDLHGVVDEGTVEVDLDKEDTDTHGITRRPAQVADDDDDDDDDDSDSRRSDDDDDDDGRQGDDDGDGDDDDPDGDGRRSDDDDDDAAYSRRVRARIAREKRVSSEAKARAEYWEKQAKETAKRLADGAKTQATATIARVTSDIEAAETALEAAIEAGNTKDQVRLTSRLTDLKAEKIQAQYQIDNADAGITFDPDATVTTTTSTDSKTPQRAKEWMDKHSDWYGARGFERETRLANRIDKDVYADGYDPNTPEYYRELNRRIKRKEPKLFDDGDGRSRNRNNGRRRQSTVAGVGGADGKRTTRSNKIELTEEDFANMRRFNLDTKDPEVLKEYARNKREPDSGARR